jgi:uncharacterized membrane protein YphA (DoxX/SURF4 family)
MTSTTPAADPAAQRSRGLHVALWIVQVLLALVFLMAGVTHAVMPVAQAAASSPWMADVPLWFARFVGIAELAGALGLVLPAATRRSPWLTPLAAVGLVLVMALAIPFHIMRGEANVIGVNIVVAALAAFVAWGRGRRVPIPERSA